VDLDYAAGELYFWVLVSVFFRKSARDLSPIFDSAPR